MVDKKKAFSFRTKIDDLSQHCKPKEQGNKCFVRFSLEGFTRLGQKFKGLTIDFTKEHWDRNELAKILPSRGIYEVIIKPIEDDLMNFFTEKKKNSKIRIDEKLYYLLEDNKEWLPNIVKFLWRMFNFKRNDKGRIYQWEINVERSYRHQILHQAIDELLQEGFRFENYSSYELGDWIDFHEEIMEIIKEKQEQYANRMIESEGEGEKSEEDQDFGDQQIADQLDAFQEAMDREEQKEFEQALEEIQEELSKEEEEASKPKKAKKRKKSKKGRKPK